MEEETIWVSFKSPVALTYGPKYEDQLPNILGVFKNATGGFVNQSSHKPEQDGRWWVRLMGIKGCAAWVLHNRPEIFRALLWDDGFTSPTYQVSDIQVHLDAAN